MNVSQRIKIDPNSITDNYLKVKLEQNINTLEFLTMNIDMKENYDSRANLAKLDTEFVNIIRAFISEEDIRV